MRILICVQRLFLIFLVSLGILIGIVQEDTWVKQWIEHRIISLFSDAASCSFRAKVAHVSLVRGVIELQQVHTQQVTQSAPPAWTWKAKRIYVAVSWYALLRGRGVELSLDIEELEAVSAYNNTTVSITEHLKNLLKSTPTAMPIIVKDVRIRQGHLQVGADDTLLRMDVSFKLDSFTRKNKKQQQLNQLFASVFDMQLEYDGYRLVDHASGTLRARMLASLPPRLEALIHIHTPVAGVADAECTLSAHAAGKLIALHLNAGASCDAHVLINESTNDLDLHAVVPAVTLGQLFGKNGAVTGICSLTAQGNLQKKIEGRVTGEHLTYSRITVPTVQSSFLYTPTNISGHSRLQLNDEKVYGCDWVYDRAAQKCSISQLRAYASYTAVSPLPDAIETGIERIEIEHSVHEDAQRLVQYAFIAPNNKQLQRGVIVYDTSGVRLDGVSEEGTYSLILGAQPQWYLQSAYYCEGDKVVTQLTGTPERSFEGRLMYSFIRTIATRFRMPDVPGEGIVEVVGTYNPDRLACGVHLQKGNIRLPYTYNIINGFSGECEVLFNERRVHFNHIHMQLYKGTLDITRATVAFGQSGCDYLFIPIRLNSCLFNIQKDIFALFSGSVIVEYRKGQPLKIRGSVLLDRSHIQGNVLSPEFQRTVLSGSGTGGGMSALEVAEIQLACITRELLTIRTPFLEAQARINCAVKGTIAQPRLEGRIELVSGLMRFPYQPLFIQRGVLYFISSSIDDPMIDLVAQNTIKKYSVTLSIGGTLRNPQLHFDAVPSLQEEQIMTLLLGGSEDGSVFLAMPSSISKSIDNLLFGPAESSSKWQKNLKNLFKTFKNIRIVPGFSDQSGRGGLRGALAIEVNDRWRALIQQNFSLTEDTRFEVEYALSDDTQIRVFQDERSDLGGEVEMRWKF